jgi:hypothetical protein
VPVGVEVVVTVPVVVWVAVVVTVPVDVSDVVTLVVADVVAGAPAEPFSLSSITTLPPHAARTRQNTEVFRR